MPERFQSSKLLARLVAQGAPISYAQRAVEELEAHWADLRSEGLERGLSDEVAGAQATEQLGSPEELADRLRDAMQRAKFPARRPVVTFVLLPFMALIAWWAAVVLAMAWAGGVFDWLALGGPRSPAGTPMPDFAALQQVLEWNRPIAGAGLALAFSWLALRNFCGFKWAFIASALLGLHNAFHFAQINHSPSSGGGFAWGYSFNAATLHLHLPELALPLLIVTLLLLFKTHQASKIHHEIAQG